MKFNTDIFFGIIIAMLLVLFTIQAKEAKKLQTQIDELSLILNEKLLSNMLTDTPTIRENYGFDN